MPNMSMKKKEIVAHYESILAATIRDCDQEVAKAKAFQSAREGQLELQLVSLQRENDRLTEFAKANNVEPLVTKIVGAMSRLVPPNKPPLTTPEMAALATMRQATQEAKWEQARLADCREEQWCYSCRDYGDGCECPL